MMVIVAWFIWDRYQSSKNIFIKTDKIEYKEGENPKIIIENRFKKSICFSSCYPYYLEENKEDKKFEAYEYGTCYNPDIAENCVLSGKTKAFELILENIVLDKGIHRIAIPACIGCYLEENFKRDKWLYSNEFMVK